MKNPCVDAALAELEANGIRDVTIACGSKHPQLRFHVNGGPAARVRSAGPLLLIGARLQTCSTRRPQDPARSRADNRAGEIATATATTTKARSNTAILEQRLATLEAIVLQRSTKEGVQ